MTALAEVVAAMEPWLGRHQADDPGPARFDDVVGDADRRFVLEAVREGYLMHYGEPQAYEGMEPDLRLLAGDALYALGLARLSDRGDLDAVAELSDLITLTARAHAEGTPRAGGSALARHLRGPVGAGWSRCAGHLARFACHPDLVTLVAMLTLLFRRR